MAASPEPHAQRPLHEVAFLFPQMDPAAYSALVESIRERGLIEEIWLHPDGSIIDGRHRYRACLEVGCEPRFRTWDGAGDLLDFVWDLNSSRRHLTRDQRVALAVRMLPHEATQAKERQARGGKSALAARGVIGGLPVRANWHELERGKAAEKVARRAGISARSVARGWALERRDPRLIDALAAGQVDLPHAQRLSKQDVDRRAAYLDHAARLKRREPLATPRAINMAWCAEHGSIQENLDIIKPSDWWAFSHPKWRQDPEFAGSIPGEVYANALYYFAPLRGIAVDAMAGSGMLRRVYDDRSRWQKDRCFDLDMRLFDLHPRAPHIARHDAREPLPLTADWIFLDPPYYMAGPQRYYEGDLANARDYGAYLALLERVITAMAASLRPGGRLLLFIPKTADPADRPVRDVPRDATHRALGAGLHWIDRAYVSRGKQQHPAAAQQNNEAKRTLRMMSDVCELNVFERPGSEEGGEG